jgi:septal ring factor EnvC (AmiA/AmiB activator)
MLIIASLLSALLLPAAGGAHAADRDDKKQELQRIKREMEEKKQQLRQADRKERSILAGLEKIDREIQAGAAELADQQRRLREAETGLAEIEQRNAGLARELERLKTAYSARLRALYKLSRSGGYAPAILSSDTFTTAYKRVRYLSVITARDRLLMQEYRETLDNLALREQEIREGRLELLARREAVESKRSALEARRRKKQELLSSVKQEMGVHEATLKDLEESSANLWAMIRLAERERPQQPAGRSSAAKGSAGRERLPWPVNGKVLANFGVQRHPQFGTAVYRRGIDIAAKAGDEVRAVAKGTVVYADWYRGYGRLIIIDHGAGLYTLYGHLSRLDVNGGVEVGREQVIGLAGDTGSLRGTKLYFEIRRNGEAEDPLSWLAKR